MVKKKAMVKEAPIMPAGPNGLQVAWGRCATALGQGLLSTVEHIVGAAKYFIPMRGRSRPMVQEATLTPSEPSRWQIAWARLRAFLASDWRELPAALVVLFRYCCRNWASVAILGCTGVLLFTCLEFLAELPSENAVANDLPGFYSARYTPSGADRPVRYGLYVPPDFKKAQGPLPMIVSLNDAGDPRQQLFREGLTLAVRKSALAGHGDFVVFFPFNSQGEWVGPRKVENLLEVLDHVMKRHRIDPQRVYLIGHSLGGCELWSLAARHPERWAALVVVSPGCLPERGQVPQVPCWVFHGDNDRRVPVQGVRDLTRVLAGKGLEVRYTEYPKASRQTWAQAYDTPGLYEWLATKSRP